MRLFAKVLTIIREDMIYYALHYRRYLMMGGLSTPHTLLGGRCTIQ